MEANQSHPIAQAILGGAGPQPEGRRSEDARYEIGYGIEARIGGRLVRAGSARYMGMLGIDSAGVPTVREQLQARGASVVYVGFEDKTGGRDRAASHAPARSERRGKSLKKLDWIVTSSPAIRRLPPHLWLGVGHRSLFCRSAASG